MSDYLILLLLSLHQRFRVAPFDKYPPPVSQIEEERIDVGNNLGFIGLFSIYMYNAHLVSNNSGRSIAQTIVDQIV